jgi:hypothetical protein
MKYEIANGTLGDAELVGTVFMKRLNAEAKRCKECSSSQLAERVGTRWNPNQHSSLHAIMRHIESNREQAFMKQAIKNIEETQDFDELIIIDDGSSDGTMEWLDKNRKSNWKIVHQENQ